MREIRVSPVILRMRQREDEDKTLGAGRMETEGSMGLTSSRSGLRETESLLTEAHKPRGPQ